MSVAPEEMARLSPVPSPGPVKSEDIKFAQQFLIGAGLLPSPIVKPDGVWTATYADALKRWQTSVGLTANGKLDAPTSKKMGDTIAYVTAANQPPPPQPVTEPTTEAVVSSTSSGTTPQAGGGAPNPDGRFTIPGGSEMWLVDGKDWFVVYRVPGTSVPLAWKVDNPDDLAAIFGPGNPPVADKTYSGAEAFAQGPLVFGTSRLLSNMSEHPFDAFTANFAAEAAIRPWLRDPEILALTTRAILENRTVTDAELAGTDWWKTHTAAERAWISDFNRDPLTAQQTIQDTRDLVRKSLLQAGIANAPDKLVNLIADRVTGGTWTQAYATSQIGKIADPAAPGTLDPTLGIWLSDVEKSGISLNTLADNTTKVDQLLMTGLGPVFSGGWSKKQREDWAGRIRNDPQAEQELIDEIKRQRLALFPEYENPDLTYDDIAGPWRGVWTQQWGAAPDETDPLFSRIVRANDLGEAQRILRREGLDRGNSTVAGSFIEGVGRSDLAGAGVRGTV